MAETNIVLTHKGAEYTAIIAKIERTFLGGEDHGIWTANLSFAWPGSGQGTGHYCLDDKPHDYFGRRIGSAYGLDHVMEIVRTLGCGSWEQVAGQTCLILKEKGRDYGQIVGIADLYAERVLIFKDHADSWAEFAALTTATGEVNG